MDTMIELPAMRRSAQFAPNTFDTDTRTVEVVWSAGARTPRVGEQGGHIDQDIAKEPEKCPSVRLSTNRVLGGLS